MATKYKLPVHVVFTLEQIAMVIVQSGSAEKAWSKKMDQRKLTHGHGKSGGLDQRKGGSQARRKELFHFSSY